MPARMPARHAESVRHQSATRATSVSQHHMRAPRRGPHLPPHRSFRRSHLGQEVLPHFAAVTSGRKFSITQISSSYTPEVKAMRSPSGWTLNPSIL